MMSYSEFLMWFEEREISLSDPEREYQSYVDSFFE